MVGYARNARGIHACRALPYQLTARPLANALTGVTGRGLLAEACHMHADCGAWGPKKRVAFLWDISEPFSECAPGNLLPGAFTTDLRLVCAWPNLKGSVPF
jgi:hypothetical protein